MYPQPFNCDIVFVRSNCFLKRLGAISIFEFKISRPTMFEVEESSIELNANPLNGLETIVEEYGSESHRRELSAHEKKELDRSRLFY